MANVVKVKSVTVRKPGSTTPVPQPASGLAGLGAALGNAIKSNQSVPKPATTPSTSTSNAIPQPTSTVKNAATSPGTAPSTGYGGATYGTDAATNRAIEANQAKIASDAAFRQSEIERTLKVIAERQGQGLDTSAQYKYLTQNLGYTPPSQSQTPAPPMPQTTDLPAYTNPTGYFNPTTIPQGDRIPTYTPTLPVKDQAAIERYVDQQIAAELARQRSTADQAIAAGELTAQQQLQALQTQYDRLRQDIGEERTLENLSFQRNANPFSGRTSYDQAMLNRERAEMDAQMAADLATRQANINQNLAQLRNEIEAKYKALQDTSGAERERLIREIMADERAYELALRGELRADILTNSDLTNQEFQRALQSYLTNRDVLESDRNFNYQREQDRIRNDAIYGGIYNGQPTAEQRNIQWQQQYQQQRDAILDDRWRQEFEEDRRRYGEQFAYQKARDAIKDEQWKKEFDEDYRRYGLDYALRKQELNAQIENMRADNARQAYAAQRQTSSSSPNLNQIINNINTLYTQYNSQTGSRSLTNPTAIRSYILSLNLPDDLTDQLLTYYGLPIR